LTALAPIHSPALSGTGRIRILPETLVKKIAAGEVVERPASVLKELIENAIDAGASRVAVTVEDGGRSLIRVVDDGCGMTAEELRLAILPHATSKIVEEDDLYRIGTLGFRGEALASISSVSKLRIVSRPAAMADGYEIGVEGDRVQRMQPIGCPPGTTVEVRDLFYNVPARRKFLRSGSTESGHLNEQFTRLALAHPRVAFELMNHQRVTYAMPPTECRVERIARFFGAELAGALLHVTRDERGVRLEAYAAPPAHSRATPQWQYAFLNGRYIRDRFLQHAVKEAYRGLMDPNRHGVVFLFLTLDPGDVDVNVHPTKIEVRWADANLIHSQMLSALRETFQRADLRPALRTDRATPVLSDEEQDRLRHELADMLKSVTPGSIGAPTGTPGPDPNRDFFAARRADPANDPLETWKTLYAPSSPTVTADGSATTAASPEPCPTPREKAPSPQPRAIQMHDLYLVAEEDDGIVIVDQHALHERVLYEQLRQRLAGGSFLPSQRLLLPETLRVTPQQAAVLEANAELLQRLGIEVTSFGTDAVAVQSFPTLLKDTQVVSFMRDLLDQLTQSAPEGPASGADTSTRTEVAIHRILDMMACKAAVKAGDRLTEEEIAALIAQRHLIAKATSCPHGRPTMLRLTKADLSRQFKRT
jgi:DNA mismatch repair protein MutL